MRRPVFIILLLAGAFAEPAAAQSSMPYVRAIASHLYIESFDVLSWKTQCPAGHIPLDYTIVRGHNYDEDEVLAFDLVDSTGARVDRNAVPSVAAITGGGYAVLLNNLEHHEKEFGVTLSCLAVSAVAGDAVTLVRTEASAAGGAVGVVNSFCPAEFPAAIGGFGNGNNMALQEVGTAPVWGTAAAPQALASVPDGQTGAPTGWQAKVLNTQTATAGIVAYAVCANVPSVQTFVYSAPVVVAFTSAFSVLGVVPDGWTGVAAGFDTGTFAFSVIADMWTQDGTVAGAEQWFPHSTYYDSASAPVRAFMYKSSRTALKVGTAAGARAIMAVLAVPQATPPPAPTSVDIIEFYHAGLDHYFITAIPKEISDLDTGVHPGWARTGQQFKAYGIGSTGKTTRRPVCRIYGLPSQGLNSHFYSASPDECFATLSNLGAWGLEASEVFEMDLPDAATGACPPGGVPVYRVWNRRYDSNHRYTTSTAIRDQMVTKGGVAEGYGPAAVALCGLP